MLHPFRRQPDPIALARSDRAKAAASLFSIGVDENAARQAIADADTAIAVAIHAANEAKVQKEADAVGRQQAARVAAVSRIAAALDAIAAASAELTRLDAALQHAGIRPPTPEASEMIADAIVRLRLAVSP